MPVLENIHSEKRSHHAFHRSFSLDRTTGQDQPDPDWPFGPLEGGARPLCAAQGCTHGWRLWGSRAHVQHCSVLFPHSWKELLHLFHPGSPTLSTRDPRRVWSRMEGTRRQQRARRATLTQEGRPGWDAQQSTGVPRAGTQWQDHAAQSTRQEKEKGAHQHLPEQSLLLWSHCALLSLLKPIY